ncbi:hypothetical protein [Azospirillum halopraeferens]|uniref:hypothetical protein n=1 Tax=Azospirillum halopraeferens TaxID=34010 RepID=UPI0003F8B3F9|nr:hypothetical protein [Azospirillum halopraeferens]
MSDPKDDPRAIEEARARLQRTGARRPADGGAIDPAAPAPAEAARGAMESDQGAPPSAGSAGVGGKRRE